MGSFTLGTGGDEILNVLGHGWRPGQSLNKALCSVNSEGTG